KLAAEGLFNTEHKRALPRFPRRIGVITSPTGAAVRDILHVLKRRFCTIPILIYPVQVQGAAAAPQIASAIRLACARADCDVLILARGGGSLEDLWAFNEEVVARAIHACTIPLVSGVGHEVDFTIADFVADVRAATPSNAAELVVDRADNFVARIDRARRRLASALSIGNARKAQRLQRLQAQLGRWPTVLVLRDRDVHQIGRRLERAVTGRVASEAQRLERLRRRLEARDLRRVAAMLQARIATAGGRLHTAIARRREAAAADVGTLSARLDALSPLAVLGRGYA